MSEASSELRLNQLNSRLSLKDKQLTLLQTDKAFLTTSNLSLQQDSSLQGMLNNDL